LEVDTFHWIFVMFKLSHCECKCYTSFDLPRPILYISSHDVTIRTSRDQFFAVSCYIRWINEWALWEFRLYLLWFLKELIQIW
jgi:hypothetical protein